MFQSNFMKKFVGFTSLVSAVLWIFLSLVLIIASLVIFGAMLNTVDSTMRNFQTHLANIKNPSIPILEVPLVDQQVWDETKKDINDSVTSTFSQVIDILRILQIGAFCLPFLVILSQVMPFVVGMQLLFDEPAPVPQKDIEIYDDL